MTTATTTNGRVKGRAAPPPVLTLSTGYTLTARRLPPMTQQRIAEAIQRLDVVRGITRPTPPLVEGAVEGVMEPNEADPDYLAALERFEQASRIEFNDRLFLFVCLDAVEFELTDEVQTLIDRTRRRLAKVGAWADDPDLEKEENDRVLFIQHIAARSAEDMQRLYRSVIEQSEPTPEVVAQHVESFPGDASGA